MTFEEMMDHGRGLILQGLHCFDQVSSLGCNKCAQTPARISETERLSVALDESQAECQQLRANNERYCYELRVSGDSNELLRARLEECEQELKNLQSINRELEARAQDGAASSHSTSLSNELEEFQTLYTQKVADLDAECSKNQVLISQQSKKLETQEAQVSDLTTQVYYFLICYL